MAGKMKCVRILEQYTDKHSKLALQENTVPTCGDREVVVKIRGSAICGSDKHFYEGLLQMKKLPLTMGHEFAGEIAEIGSLVTNVKVGDRVACELQIDFCGNCKLCHSGDTHLCAHKVCPGLHIEGAYAEYITMPANMMHKLPDSVSFKAAAVVEPAAVVATGLLERCQVRPEDVVVIYGAGPLGLVALQMCKIVGANTVIMVETYNKLRADKARQWADHVIDDVSVDVPKFVKDLTGGFGADLAVDCAGAEQSLNNCINSVKRNGRVSYIAVPSTPLMTEMDTLAWNALSIIGTYASTSSSWDMVISMVARGALDLESLVTHTFPLEEYEEAFRVLVDNEAIKVVFAPGGPI